MKKYEKVILSSGKVVQYFADVPMGKKFKIYSDVGMSTMHCYIVFEKDNVDIEDFNAEKQIDAFDNLGGGNVINSNGIEFNFNEPKKLYFFIRNIDKPIKIHVEVE